MTNNQDVNNLIGTELGVSEWFTITQEMVNQFAELTHDSQWIHVNVIKAKQHMPDTGTIVHGFYTASMTSYLMGQVLKGSLPVSFTSRISRIINYGINRLRFTNAVPVGSNIRAKVSVVDAESTPKGIQITYGVSMEIEGKDKPALVSENVVFYLLK